MNNKEIKGKARELLECLGMWGIPIEDARKICKEMLSQSLVLKETPNPLAGTGLKALTGDDDDRANLIRSRIFHEPQGEA